MSVRTLALVALIAPITVMAAGPAVPNDAAAVEHALSRLTFGVRDGDVARVQRLGLAKWMDDQLHPERIADAAAEARLASLPTLALDSDTIAREYVRPAMMARRQAQRAAGSMEPPQMESPRTENPRMDGPRPRWGDPLEQKRRQPLQELSHAKLLRAVYSEHQLEEVLADFWFNHFNVSAAKGRTEVFITEYDRDVIRPRVLGSFRDLLGAVAKSPAMLFYLDSAMSRSGAINENYARELLELHTLGVDGGYTQQDIVEVARAFTGWSLTPLGRGEAGALFAARQHDNRVKTILGHTLPANGGQADAERVLDIVAAHPSTARHIARKLVERFVSDTPPAALVERVAKRFTETKGDLRETVRAVITSPEFFAPEARMAKVKTPFEFVASALRVSGADVQNGTALTRTLRDLGMPSYMCQPPTGYDDGAEAWVSTGALVARINFAQELAGNRIRGVRVHAGDTESLAARLGSPEFQKQ